MNNKTKVREISAGEYYHIYNRGVHNDLTFLDDYDKARFICAILFFQGKSSLFNLSEHTKKYLSHGAFKLHPLTKKTILEGRSVELVNFAIMPNHFHITVLENKAGGISRYMQRVQNAYTKFFNTKYKKSGHLFQGKFKFVHIEDNNQLLYLSTYIHKNSRDLSLWKGRESEYPWSSYTDYVKENRWGEFLKHDIISSQFKNKKDYDKFVRDSTAKELGKKIDPEHFLNEV